MGMSVLTERLARSYITGDLTERNYYGILKIGR